jgi:PAS domain S-box-containing protein
MPVKPKSAVKSKSASKTKPAVKKRSTVKPNKKITSKQYDIAHLSKEIISHMCVGIYIVQNGKFVYASPLFQKLSGYSPSDLLGTNPLDHVHPEDRETVRQKAIKSLKEKCGSYEYRFVRKNGEIIWVMEMVTSIAYKGKRAALGSFMDITEHNRREDELRRSEEKYRTIMEDMEEGYFETDLKGNFTFVNDAECRNMGYSREELIGMNNRQYTDKENAKKAFQAFVNLYKTGESSQIFDYEVIKKDGTKTIAELLISLVKDSSGKPIGFRGLSRHITERKKIEEALRRNEERYRTILNSIQEAYFEFDLAGKITFINDTLWKRLGYSKEELLGHTNKVFTDEATRKESFRAFNELYKTGVPVKALTQKNIRKDGSIRISELSVSLMRDSGGKPIGFFGTSRDVTERRRAEETLTRSEEKYRRLVENAQEGIYQSIVGYLSLNQALARMLGYDSPEEVMATITDIAKQLYVNPDDRKKLLEIVNEKGSVTDFETEYYKKDGSRLWVSINMHAVRDDQGRIIYYQGINQDITEKKKIEDERRGNIERLRKSLGATINAMAVTVETRDPYTAGHQRRVADLARAIATEMNLTSDQIDGVRMASTIHDIGKISIPSEILTKPTKLSDLEFNLIKTHPASGYNILKDIEFPWPIAQIVLEHHERIDGSGYPNGLKGEQILLESKIIAIADVVEAISSHRPYRPAHGIEVALDEITKNRSILFDPDLVDACLRLFREKNYNLAAL